MQHQIVNPGKIQLWDDHRNSWNQCRACPLHKNAHKHVLFRGTIPCDILFVGEAPGRTEDTLGIPFIGRAGKCLDEMLFAVQCQLAGGDWAGPSYAITNTVACIPFPPESDIASPKQEHIDCCSPRVEDFIQIANPKLLVVLGEVAKKSLRHYAKSELPLVHLYHPSYILRRGGRTSVEFKKWVHKLVGHIIEYKVGCNDNPKAKKRVRKTVNP